MPRIGPRKFHGKTIYDATKGVHLHIDRKACEAGKENDPQHCAAAEAIRKQFPDVVGVHVHRSTVMVEHPRRVVRYHTSGALRDQQLRFDAGRKFEPGRYSLLPVSESVIASRGRQHSPPDRTRGDPNSPKRRGKPTTLKRVLGRGTFRYSDGDENI